MKLYDKRLAFMISDQHFIPHGGIGSFARTFFEMCDSLNWRCDIVLDKKPRESVLLDWFKTNQAQIYCPDAPLGYSDHQNKFVFSDTLNFEKVINFRNAITKALSNHIYDAIVVNTPEATPAVYILDIFKFIPVMFYTHNENLVFMNAKKSDVFNEAFDNISKSMMTWNGITIATQSQKNVDAINSSLLGAEAYELPMRVPERGLLEKNIPWDQKEGVLFIGRHEPRKNPEAFVDAIVKTKLKPLILTNQKGKEKFEAEFKTAGIKDYDIRAGIIGKEKVEFIKSARIAYHPSRLESYGFSAFESLHSCPTFALKEFDWYSAFNINNVQMVHPLEKNNIVETLLAAYAEPETYYGNTLFNLIDWDAQIALKWQIFVQEKQILNSDTRETKVTTYVAQNQTSVIDLYRIGLKRTAIAADDIQSVYAKRHLFKTYQTNDNTYLSTKDFEEPTKDIFDSIFEIG